MYKYYKIKKDKISSYSGLKAFIEFAHSMYEPNISEKDGIYYYYRLAPGHQDTVVMTKVKLEDLEEVDLKGNVIVSKEEIEEKTYFDDVYFDVYCVETGDIIGSPDDAKGTRDKLKDLREKNPGLTYKSFMTK